jgi:hypothetical protein
VSPQPRDNGRNISPDDPHALMIGPPTAQLKSTGHVNVIFKVGGK